MGKCMTFSRDERPKYSCQFGNSKDCGSVSQSCKVLSALIQLTKRLLPWMSSVLRTAGGLLREVRTRPSSALPYWAESPWVPFSNWHNKSKKSSRQPVLFQEIMSIHQPGHGKTVLTMDAFRIFITSFKPGPTQIPPPFLYLSSGNAAAGWLLAPSDAYLSAHAERIEMDVSWEVVNDRRAAVEG